MNDLLIGLTSGDDTRAEEAAQELKRLGEQAIPALSQLSEDKHPDKRWWAVRTLAMFDGEEASRAVRQRLMDENPHVQYCAAVALRERPDPRAVPALVELLSSKDRLLAHLATNALAATGKEATPALLEVLKHGEQVARLGAVRALAEIGDHDSIAALFELLDEDSMLMEYWASEGLDKMGVGMRFFKVG